jgi:hypothetical protein
MRNMSFALTRQPMVRRTKLVTRRLGWEFLKVGDLLQPVEKCMGLKPGERIQKIGAPIRVVGLRREPLRMLTDDPDYGLAECALEGFGDHPLFRWPSEFVTMFCASHRGCTPSTVITRIEFAFTDNKEHPQ